MRVSGKVIIVTGAASGMGKAMAELFAAEGAHVVVSDIHYAGAQEVAEAITKNGGTAIAIETCRRRIDQKHGLSLCKRRNPL